MLIKKRPRWISERLWHRLMRQRERHTHLRRQALRFLRSPALATAYSAYRRAVREADWPLVEKRIKILARLAVEAKDRRTIAEMVKALDQVGHHQESSRLWLSELADRAKSLPNEWHGEDLANKTALVHLNYTWRQGLGTAYRCASLLSEIIDRAERTIVIVEPRLVPTFRRSFPEAEVFASLDGARATNIDFIVLPTYLIASMAAKSGEHRRFRALLPDRLKAAELRAAYQGRGRCYGERPLVGICWHSSHYGKEVPKLSVWHDFIRRIDAEFVSLQYGDVATDVAALGSDRILVDPSIDQMKDMDAFSAQVAALDGVITIVNTLAHVGGALGIPTVVLRDDLFRREWPVQSDRVPWYPTVRIVGKDRRDWGAVFDDAWIKLRQLVTEKSAHRSGASTAFESPETQPFRQ